MAANPGDGSPATRERGGTRNDEVACNGPACRVDATSRDDARGGEAERRTAAPQSRPRRARATRLRWCCAGQAIARRRFSGASAPVPQLLNTTTDGSDSISHTWQRIARSPGSRPDAPHCSARTANSPSPLRVSRQPSLSRPAPSARRACRASVRVTVLWAGDSCPHCGQPLQCAASRTPGAACTLVCDWCGLTLTFRVARMSTTFCPRCLVRRDPVEGLPRGGHCTWPVRSGYARASTSIRGRPS